MKFLSSYVPLSSAPETQSDLPAIENWGKSPPHQEVTQTSDTFPLKLLKASHHCPRCWVFLKKCKMETHTYHREDLLEETLLLPIVRGRNLVLTRPTWNC